MNALRGIGWSVMAVSAVVIAAWSAFRYWGFDPDRYFDEQVEVYRRHLPALGVHVICGPLALVLGAFQFPASVRRRWPRLHRVIGKGYFVMVAGAALSGLWLAAVAYGGVVARSGFALLAVVWLVTAYVAWREIQRGEVVAHQRWVMRSYALALSGVTLRLWIAVLVSLPGWDFAAAYAVIAWLCWLPNLALAEWMVRHRWRPAER